MYREKYNSLKYGTIKIQMLSSATSEFQLLYTNLKLLQTSFMVSSILLRRDAYSCLCLPSWSVSVTSMYFLLHCFIVSLWWFLLASVKSSLGVTPWIWSVTVTLVSCILLWSICQYFLQTPLLLCVPCMKAKSLQSCLTLWNLMDLSPPGFFFHGILQARILEWVAVPSSRGSSQPRDRTCFSHVSCFSRRVLYH